MSGLSREDSLRIAALIANFRGRITWDDVVALGEEVTGLTYSKPTLWGRDCIRLAYDRSNGKNQPGPKKRTRRPKSKELSTVEDRLAKTKKVLEEKDALIAQLTEQFLVWAENARKRGVTEADLNAELPMVDRGRTEDPKKK